MCYTAITIAICRRYVMSRSTTRTCFSLVAVDNHTMFEVAVLGEVCEEHDVVVSEEQVGHQVASLVRHETVLAAEVALVRGQDALPAEVVAIEAESQQSELGGRLVRLGTVRVREENHAGTSAMMRVHVDVTIRKRERTDRPASGTGTTRRREVSCDKKTL